MPGLPPVVSLPFDGRLVVSIVTVLVLSVFVSYTVPKGALLAARGVNATLDRWGFREVAGALWDHTPPGVSFQGAVYSAQAAVLTFGGLFLLSVWGQGRVVGFAVKLLTASVPSLVRLGLTGLLLAGMYSTSQYIGDWAGGLDDDSAYVEDHTTEILARSLQLILLLGGTLTILSIWKVDVNSFLIGAGVLSVMVGFAARDTFSSVVAGFVLMFSRPFEVGDWIEVSDREGQVTAVTIVSTRLRTPEAEDVIIPNDIISESEIINYSNEQKLCLSLDIGVAYRTDLDHAAETITDAMADVNLLSDGSAVEVFPSRFEDSSIVLEVRFWIDHPNPRTRRRARAAAVERIQSAFDREGIEIPFPQRDVNAQLPDRVEADDLIVE